MDDILTVYGDDLDATDLERLEQAFLSHGGTVLWGGRRYTVSAMDQSYPEDESEAVRLTFTLKPATLKAAETDEGSEHY